MKVTVVKTGKVRAGDELLAVIDAAISELAEASVVAVTSKIVALAENRVVKFGDIDKQELIEAEADRYLPVGASRYGVQFSVKNNTLIPTAGIDESNGDGYYVLWPSDAFASANIIRKHLASRFGLAKLGVIITDSTCSPMRRGTTGIALAWSGFKALNDYVGRPDLFGKPFKYSQSSIAGGLAAASVVAMGEGAESTPLAILEDLSFVEFTNRDASATERAYVNIPLEEDLFAPFLTKADWQRGDQSSE